MRQMGIRDTVLQMLERIGLGTICTKQYDTHPELVRQFLSTARVYYANDLVRKAQEGILTFMIRGVRYRLPLPELCLLFGFDSEPQGVSLPTIPDLQSYWSYFGNGIYDSKTSTQTDIRHPVLRYVVRLFANTILCKMEPGKMRVSELTLLAYGLEDLFPPGLEPVNLGAVFAEHLASLKTKAFTGTKAKFECVGSLLTPIFEHFGIIGTSYAVLTSRSTMDDVYLRSTRWLKPDWIWCFAMAGAQRRIRLPRRTLTDITDDITCLEFRPAQRDLITPAQSRLTRTAFSPPAPTPDLAGGHFGDPSASSSHAPAFPTAPEVPMETAVFQRYVVESLQSIWSAIAAIPRCSCVRPPTPPRDDASAED